MTTNNKHAPGPWKVNVVRATKTQDRVTDREGYPVALVEIGTNEANARLIAAAPDLLEALHVADAYISEHVTQRATDDRRIHALHTLRAAIAKATQP